MTHTINRKSLAAGFVLAGLSLVSGLAAATPASANTGSCAALRPHPTSLVHSLSAAEQDQRDRAISQCQRAKLTQNHVNFAQQQHNVTPTSPVMERVEH